MTGKLICKSCKKTCKYLNYIDHLLVLVSTVTVYVSISAFVSLTGVPVVITSCVVGIKICAITAGIKKTKSTIQKQKRNKHDNIALLRKNKLDSIEILISKTLID